MRPGQCVKACWMMHDMTQPRAHVTQNQMWAGSSVNQCSRPRRAKTMRLGIVYSICYTPIDMHTGEP